MFDFVTPQDYLVERKYELLFEPMQIRIFLLKRLVRKLGKTDLSEFFTQLYLQIT